MAAATTLGACGPARRPADAAAQGAALREVLVAREHARQIVLWTDPAEPGPAFEPLGHRDVPADPAALASAVGVPVVPIAAADLARLFRAHPDGWAAFYAAHPGAPGVVELARPAWSGDTLATVVVGRACGEHCVNAWRVTVRVGAAGAPRGARVVATAPLRIPKQ